MGTLSRDYGACTLYNDQVMYTFAFKHAALSSYQLFCNEVFNCGCLKSSLQGLKLLLYAGVCVLWGWGVKLSVCCNVREIFRCQVCTRYTGFVNYCRQR